MSKAFIDLTAKELLNRKFECSTLVTVYGFDFFITADRMDNQPVIYIDTSNVVELELDNEKHFKSVRACINDIKKQLRSLSKRLLNGIREDASL